MSVLRRISVWLGLAGGAAGLAVHAYLLAGVMAQSDASSEEVKRLAVGVALGAAGIAAALAIVASRPVGMTFLFSLAVLGLFPNLLTWAPAAALMILAGIVGLVDLRRAASPRPSGVKPVAGIAPQAAPTPSTVAAVTYAAPDATSLHWSVVPRYARTVLQPRAASAPVLVSPFVPESYALPGDAPQVASAPERVSWSRRSRALVAVTVVAAALVVVPFSVWPQETVAAAAGPTTSTTPTTSSNRATALAGLPVVQQPTASTTTLVTTLSEVGPTGTSSPTAFVLYSDVRFGLTISMPADWAELPASSLADYRADDYHLAAFADVDGPTRQDAYLNGLTIKVLAGSQTEDPPQELVRQALQQFLDRGPSAYDYFKVVKPIRATKVGGVDALVATVRITWNERVMVKSVYTCIANHCLYRVDLQTDDADWTGYQPLFEQILASFTWATNGASL